MRTAPSGWPIRPFEPRTLAPANLRSPNHRHQGVARSTPAAFRKTGHTRLIGAPPARRQACTMQASLTSRVQPLQRTRAGASQRSVAQVVCKAGPADERPRPQYVPNYISDPSYVRVSEMQHVDLSCMGGRGAVAAPLLRRAAGGAAPWHLCTPPSWHATLQVASTPASAL